MNLILVKVNERFGKKCWEGLLFHENVTVCSFFNPLFRRYAAFFYGFCSYNGCTNGNPIVAVKFAAPRFMARSLHAAGSLAGSNKGCFVDVRRCGVCVCVCVWWRYRAGSQGRNPRFRMLCFPPTAASFLEEKTPDFYMLVHIYYAVPCRNNSHIPCLVLRSFVKIRVEPENSEVPIVKVRVVAGRSRTWADRPQAVHVNSHMSCRAHAVLYRDLEKSLAKRHGRNTAGARHGMRESNTVTLCYWNGKDTL